ncbi:hypothetical protein PoB_000370100 [Plakobranchus ocellatus]|uniref:Uncharacterized protein n=1 Tax=Plakobranchus ocellatus TaxID=259542 RepID=A0AAV3XKR7_9GAST|nr:hypothetical protein PoB_000370100 [Plakobranchus ocellatus]
MRQSQITHYVGGIRWSRGQNRPAIPKNWKKVEGHRSRRRGERMPQNKRGNRSNSNRPQGPWIKWWSKTEGKEKRDMIIDEIRNKEDSTRVQKAVSARSVDELGHCHTEILNME